MLRRLRLLPHATPPCPRLSSPNCLGLSCCGCCCSCPMPAGLARRCMLDCSGPSCCGCGCCGSCPAPTPAHVARHCLPNCCGPSCWGCCRSCPTPLGNVSEAGERHVIVRAGRGACRWPTSMVCKKVEKPTPLPLRLGPPPAAEARAQLPCPSYGCLAARSVKYVNLTFSLFKLDSAVQLNFRLA